MRNIKSIDEFLTENLSQINEKSNELLSIEELRENSHK